ncbi:MAG: glycosyltransferase family 39 protein, partial [Bacteroidota bacterium]
MALAILHALSAVFLDLNGDEAYYWMFGQHLDLGYFDHPPGIAFLAKLSGFLPGNHFVFRLPALLLGVLGHLILGQVVLERKWNLENFLIAYWVLPVFHLFGFVMTPDAPMLFFTSVFIWLIHKYDQRGWTWHWIIYALVLAAMVYSKYQGAIVLMLALLPWKRFWNWKFLGFTACAVLLVVPHLLWLNDNNWVTFDYHLSGRSTGFDPENVLMFIVGQAIILNPYLLSRWVQYGKKEEDVLVRMSQRVIIGMFIFFLIASFKGRAEIHWTSASSIFLAMIFSQLRWKEKWHRVPVVAALLILGVLHFGVWVNPVNSVTFSAK